MHKTNKLCDPDEGYYFNKEKEEAQKCHLTCKECNGGLYNNCTECRSNYKLIKGVCLKVESKPCSKYCKVCQNG